MKFIDEARIEVVGGRGGNGSASMRREKFVPRGGPDGGDGGKGGSVVAVADKDINTLVDYRFTRRYDAKRGENGGAKNCSGRGADDIYLSVPIGTTVVDTETGEVLADLTKKGQTARIAKGGDVGNGHNQNFEAVGPAGDKPGQRA